MTLTALRHELAQLIADYHWATDPNELNKIKDEIVSKTLIYKRLEKGFESP